MRHKVSPDTPAHFCSIVYDALKNFRQLKSIESHNLTLALNIQPRYLFH